jgi:protein-S-isoprenylcysteine O-methyltransferase Ste14
MRGAADVVAKRVSATIGAERRPARLNTDNPFVLGTIGVWVALEIALVVRDRIRGTGGTAQDRGTRRLIALVTASSFVLAGVIARALRHHSALWLPAGNTEAPVVVGLVLMWAGLALRVWSIATLGAEFRTTVEVDAGQQLVERGPYRVLRHPSYSGVVLLAAGYGVLTGVWPALLVAVIGPTLVLMRRIKVEERALAETMGDSYRDYQRRTRRLVPGVW